VYKCKDCIKVCHRKNHKKLVEKVLKCKEQLEKIKSSFEINNYEIVAQKSVHEIGEKKEMNCKIKRKNDISHFCRLTKSQIPA